MNSRHILIDIDAVWLALQTQIRQHADYVIDGKCTDYADYKALTSRIRGLRDAERTIHEQLRKQNDDGDI